MNIPKLGIQHEKATILLGAGASRGASCFEGKQVAPPLDVDFFTQVQSLDLLKEDEKIQYLLDFVRSEFDPALGIPMEKFFTQVEALDDFYDTARIDRGPRVRRYRNILDNYTATLAAIFDRVGKQAGLAGALRCNYHEKLAGMLEHGNENFPKDVILSFNYDCIMDEALKAKARKRWDAARGYGCNVTVGADFWHNHAGPGRNATFSIQLLKLHGSLNWKRTLPTAAPNPPTDGIELRANPYESTDRSPLEIVPPVWNKAVGEDPVLTAIWKAARQALRDGGVMIVVGYSVPDTDLLSQSLLHVAPTENGNMISNLIIINPDPGARRKLVEILRNALGAQSRVLHLNTLKDFAKQLT
ncbi:MAG TPA: hypothetical protein VFC44_18320 [Candidatus Saccharimonadales bacterium]|nr:hypothetical protein [Candidatus Saccharimonadales bacterium]